VAFFSIGRRYREFHRLAQVVQVLARHGLGHFVERMNLPLPGRLLRRERHVESTRTSRALAEHAAAAMQELGPTFVKLGQFLSTRPDLVPPVYVEEFSRLQDRVEPFPADEARRIIEAELGAPVGMLFREFRDVPIASGSIAQVHWAETADGRAVVVKVKRPAIAKTVSSDLELLRALAGRLEDSVPESRPMRPRMLVDELGRSLRRELDFLHEAAATDRFHKAMTETQDFRGKYYGPKVWWDLTTSSVLTLERVSGRRITEFIAGADAETRKTLAARLFDLYMAQLFRLGFFNADPHPGNMLVGDDLCINLIDFGQTGVVSEGLQTQIATGVLAVKSGDIELLMSVFDDMGLFGEGGDVSDFRSDLRAMIDTYFGMPIGRIRVGDIFYQMNAVAQQHALALPRDFVLMGKAMVTASGIARDLDPEFNSAGAIEPYMTLLLKKRFSPSSLGKSLAYMAFHGAQLLRDSPANMRRFVRKLVTDGFSINFQHRGLEKLITDLDRASNRLAFSVIVASLIIASSLILTSRVGPAVFGISVLGILGYLFAGVLGVWLIWGIMRSGRL
jgi:ubiquinone biosynthesis protein